jgi:hypothetical protein
MATPPDFSVGAVLTAAQMNQVGMWKITPSAVSGTGASIQTDGSVLVATGGTTFTITDAFPTDYQVFHLIINDLILSTDQGILFRLVTGGTASQTGYYYGLAFGSAGYGGTYNTETGANQTSFSPRIISGTGGGGAASIMVYQPNLAKPTSFTYTSSDPRAGGAPIFHGSGYHSVATAYSSITFLTNGANFTRCRVSIYGYN